MATRQYSTSHLHFDLRNPRLGRSPVYSDSDARARLIERHGDHVYALARDISRHGLSPLEAFAVVEESGRRIVLEGNRRLLACQLLRNPDLAQDLDQRARYRRLAKQSDEKEIDKVTAALFPDRKAARHWIVLKHQGQGLGEGTAGWGPEMKYLDAVNNGASRNPAYEFWYWMDRAYVSDPDMMKLVDQARDAQFTLMERIYRTTLPTKIGAHLEPGHDLEVAVEPEVLRPFVLELAERMLATGDKRIDSRALNSSTKAQAIVDEMLERLVVRQVPLVPPPEGAAMPGTSQSRPPIAVVPAVDVGMSPEAVPAGTPSATVPATTPGSTSKSPRTPNAANLYYEIGSVAGLPGQLTPLLRACKKVKIADAHVASVMARVALELVVDAYLGKLVKDQMIPQNQAQGKLKAKLKVALHQLDSGLANGRPRYPDIAGAWSAVRSDAHDSGHFISDLNACVHSFEFTAVEGVANQANRVFTPVLRLMLEKLR